MFNLQHALENNVVCQKRTGKRKQFVIMYDDKIYKGPFSEKALNLIDERSGLFAEWQTPLIVHPQRNPDGTLHLVQSEEGPFIVYRNLAQGYPTVADWHTEGWLGGRRYQVLRRSGLIKAADALKENNGILTPEKIKDLLLAFAQIYILNVGDTGFHNILADVNQNELYIIDYDESATKEREGELFFFSKPPARELADRWLAAARPFYPEVLIKLSTIWELHQEDLNPDQHRRYQNIKRAWTRDEIPPTIRQDNLLEARALPHTILEKKTEDELKKMTIPLLKEALKAAKISMTGLKKKDDFIQKYLLSLQGNGQIPTEKGNGKEKEKVETENNTDHVKERGQMKWGGLFAGSQTYSGLPLDVAKSALQKYIRRGMSEKAEMAAFELYRMAEIGGVSAQTNMYNRLAVISTEDIGPANMSLVLTVLDLLDHGNRDPATLATIVQALCQSEKTRMMSHLWRAYGLPEGREIAKAHGLEIDEDLRPDDFEYLQKQKEQKETSFWKPGDPEEIQAYAEIFLRRLRMKDPNAITWLSYYQIASKDKKVQPRDRRTNPMIVIWDMMGTVMDPLMHRILKKAYFKYTEGRPFIMAAILAIMKEETGEVLNFEESVQIWADAPMLNQLLQGDYHFEVDPYVIDKHTKLGKAQGLGREEFVHVGAQIENRSEKYFDPILETIYQA